MAYKGVKNNNTGTYQIKIVPVNENYELEIQPAMYEVEYTRKEIEISPTVLIKKKKINTYKPDYSVSNDELDVIITKIDAVAKHHSGDRVAEDLSITLDISNKSNKYIDIEAISFYFNNDIYTLNTKYKLPPMSKQEKITLRTKEIGVVRKVDVNESLARYLSLEESKKISTNIGLSVGYIINGTEQNLFKKSNITLYELMNAAY